MTQANSSPKIKLTYFNFPGGRGEEIRLVLHIAGVAFVDERIEREDWPAIKEKTPYSELPIVEFAGEGVLAQSNAILILLGRRYNMLPKDEFTAARHHALLCAAEDLSMRISVTIHMDDAEEKKKAREKLVEGYMQNWAVNMEKQIQGPFVAGEQLSVADIKLFVLVGWIRLGILDHIPASFFERFPKLTGLYNAVNQHPKVIAWYKK